MSTKRKVEFFSAGCPVCDESLKTVQELAGPSCEIDVLDLNDQNVAARAADLGIRSVPAVVVDGVLASCCSGRGLDADVLRAAGVGQPIL